MKFIIDKPNYNINDNLFQQILNKYEKSIKENQKEIEELNKMDLEYNKRIVSIIELVEVISIFKGKNIEKKSETNIIFYYGNPIITIQVLLETLRCNNSANICIENQCLAVNKLLYKLLMSILEEFKIKNVIMLETYKMKQIEEDIELFDHAIFIGNRNLYSLLKDRTTNEKFIPYDCLDILVLDEKYEDFARQILNLCIENDVETEIYEDMKEEQAIKYLNQYGNKYMILILSENKEQAEKICKRLNYKYVLINENPFNKKVSSIII